MASAASTYCKYFAQTALFLGPAGIHIVVRPETEESAGDFFHIVFSHSVGWTSFGEDGVASISARNSLFTEIIEGKRRILLVNTIEDYS